MKKQLKSKKTNNLGKQKLDVLKMRDSAVKIILQEQNRYF